MINPYLLHEAEIVERIDEAAGIFTLRLRFTDPDVHRTYQFHPGQFNMVYLYGVGEVAISIVSDPRDEDLYDHTIRAVGRVTRGLMQLRTVRSLEKAQACWCWRNPATQKSAGRRSLLNLPAVLRV